MKHVLIRGYNHFFEDINQDKKEVILMIHGHPFDHSMWNFQIEALKDFRLILPDLTGYGKTDFKTQKIFIEEQALDLAILLDELKIQRIHLIGHSMGGQIIVEFTRLFPDRVISLIICDSSPAGETKPSYYKRLDLAERIQSIGMQEYTEKDIYKYLHPDTIKQRGTAYNLLYQMMINTKLDGAVASLRGRADRRDNFNHLRRIKVPALVVVGDSDFFTPPEEMEIVAKQISDSKFEIIPNAGHVPNIEQPEVFNKLIVEFYDQFR